MLTDKEKEAARTGKVRLYVRGVVVWGINDEL